MTACPCGSGSSYDECCSRIHAGAALGTTAQQLMRARYSAYVLGDDEFLLTSWHPDTRPASVSLDGVEWLGLDVVATDRGGALDATGTVEFRARFRRGDEYLELHELSSFTRTGGRWLYVDGTSPGS